MGKEKKKDKSKYSWWRRMAKHDGRVTQCLERQKEGEVETSSL
jgi:hypothetical protein